MIMKKTVAASVLATSLLFSGGVISSFDSEVSAAVKVSKYQTDLDKFAAYYAKVFRTLENYKNQLDKAKSENEARKIYDQYLSYFDKMLQDDTAVKGQNAEILKMDEYIYDSLFAMYDHENDAVDYLNGEMTEAEYRKAYNEMTKFVDAQDALFKKAASSYKTKHKITFSRDMLYLIDQEAEGKPVQGKTYTVKKGDSLYRIAVANHTSVAAIKKLNNLKSDSLKIGQKLKLPTAATAPAPAPSPASSYTVRKGDTLYGISKKVKVSVADLKNFNHLKSDMIRVGQILKLKK